MPDWKGTKDCEALAKPSSDSKLKLRMTRPCNDKLECRCVDAEGSILLLRSMYSYTSLDTVSRRCLISIGVSGAAVPVFAWLSAGIEVSSVWFHRVCVLNSVNLASDCMLALGAQDTRTLSPSQFHTAPLACPGVRSKPHRAKPT